MKSFKEIALPAVVLFAICLVSTALLALTNNVTASRIEALSAQTEVKSRAQVLPAAVSFGEAETARMDGTEYKYHVGYNENGAVAGYTFTTCAKGYGGDVVIMTGVDTAGAVTGIEALSLNETAGLGMNARKESFRSRFVGKSGVIGVSTAGAKADNGIDAMTGATITSRAVTNAVNLALRLYAQTAGGEG